MKRSKKFGINIAIRTGVIEKTQSGGRRKQKRFRALFKYISSLMSPIISQI